MNLGHLYHMMAARSVPPKPKLMICVCADTNMFFWINTRRRSNIGQIYLRPIDHRALAHDCFLDCSVIMSANRSEMEAAQDRGCISERLCDEIIRLLEDAPPETLTQAQCVKIVSNLTSLY